MQAPADAAVAPTKILGYDIHFPSGKKPFPPQLAVISRALHALSRGQNALLESPTGTGKVCKSHVVFVASAVFLMVSCFFEDAGVIISRLSISKANERRTIFVPEIQGH